MRISRRLLLVSIAIVFIASDAFAQRTMRFDYYHTGNARQEMFSLDRVVIEPLEWPGSPSKTIDRTNLGKYFFEVQDRGGRVIYSRGFASVYGEWETTEEAQKINRTFHESLRFPEPTGPPMPTRRVMSGTASNTGSRAGSKRAPARA